MGEILYRTEETRAIEQRLVKKKSFLLHGPTGVGKTLVLGCVVAKIPALLYCQNSASSQEMFRGIAQGLLHGGASRIRQACRNDEGIRSKSAVALKGIVMDALREGSFSIVLDHVSQPSQSFATAVREIMGWCSTPVIAVARSIHMEDAGFLQPLYSDRHDRYELKNFDAATAGRFIHEMAERQKLSASNMSEFLSKVLDFSEGNPAAILSMLRMSTLAKYRSQEHIKISPLYIDFRMNRSH